jgi:hypothetical protein
LVVAAPVEQDFFGIRRRPIINIEFDIIAKLQTKVIALSLLLSDQPFFAFF